MFARGRPDSPGRGASTASPGVAFHPFFRDDYRTWLESDPLDRPKPLPVGPVELVWEDGLVVGALILLEPDPAQIRVDPHLEHLPDRSSARADADVLVDAEPGLRLRRGLRRLGLAVRLWHSPWPASPSLAAVYLMVYEGLWRSLARFPWE